MRRFGPFFEHGNGSENLKLTGWRIFRVLVYDPREPCHDDSGPRTELENRQATALRTPHI